MDRESQAIIKGCCGKPRHIPVFFPLALFLKMTLMKSEFNVDHEDVLMVTRKKKVPTSKEDEKWLY
jgi:hypothetical protein